MIIPAGKLPNGTDWLIDLAENFEAACILDSHSGYFTGTGNAINHKYDYLAAYCIDPESDIHIKTFRDLANISQHNSLWYFGYLCYDLKNSVENLVSCNTDNLFWPEILLFRPDVIFYKLGECITLLVNSASISIRQVFMKIRELPIYSQSLGLIDWQSRITKDEYLHSISQIKEHIRKGDIYEINFCQEFYANTDLDAYSAFRTLNHFSPAPFSSFIKYKDNFLLSLSPERFLKKEDSILLAQPIKGSARRGITTDEEKEIIHNLVHSIKERSENIMIVDLTRNDLSKIAEKDSVKVDELCGIYRFPHILQMISTVSAQIKPCTFKEIISSMFPMGSMTGAPKIKAMELIDRYETMRRGLYSGTVGYITPEFNFDFSVVIRSMQYNAKHHHLSYMAGSAITDLSDPEEEYNECLMKAYGIFKESNMMAYV